MKKCICTLFTGVIMGMIIGVTIYPEMDRNTKRMIKKAKKKVINKANDSYDAITNIM